ncbi:MAG TPA: hypothetical protein VGJ82_12745, partial [Thermoanaerobaculia bacterium]
ILVLVRPDSRRHLVLQVEFSLLQRLFLHFLVRSDLMLSGQLVEAVFAMVVLLNPLPELGIFCGENLLNVSGTIRHQLSSFEVPDE